MLCPAPAHAASGLALLLAAEAGLCPCGSVASGCPYLLQPRARLCPRVPAKAKDTEGSLSSAQAMSPDGEAIVTGAGDETLRFWNVFSKTRSTKVRGWRQPGQPWAWAEWAALLTGPVSAGVRVGAQPLHPDPVDPRRASALSRAEPRPSCAWTCRRSPGTQLGGREPGLDTLQSLIKRLIVNHVHQYLGRGPGTLGIGASSPFPKGKSPGSPRPSTTVSTRAGWTPPGPPCLCPASLGLHAVLEARAICCHCLLPRQPAGRQGWPEGRGRAGGPRPRVQPELHRSAWPEEPAANGVFAATCATARQGSQCHWSGDLGGTGWTAGPVSCGRTPGGLILRTAEHTCPTSPSALPCSCVPRLRDLNVSVPAGRGVPSAAWPGARWPWCVCCASPPLGPSRWPPASGRPERTGAGPGPPDAAWAPTSDPACPSAGPAPCPAHRPAGSPQDGVARPQQPLVPWMMGPGQVGGAGRSREARGTLLARRPAVCVHVYIRTRDCHLCPVFCWAVPGVDGGWAVVPSSTMARVLLGSVLFLLRFFFKQENRPVSPRLQQLPGAAAGLAWGGHGACAAPLERRQDSLLPRSRAWAVVLWEVTRQRHCPPASWGSCGEAWLDVVGPAWSQGHLLLACLRDTTATGTSSSCQGQAPLAVPWGQARCPCPGSPASL